MVWECADLAGQPGEICSRLDWEEESSGVMAQAADAGGLCSVAPDFHGGSVAVLYCPVLYCTDCTALCFDSLAVAVAVSSFRSCSFPTRTHIYIHTHTNPSIHACHALTLERCHDASGCARGSSYIEVSFIDQVAVPPSSSADRTCQLGYQCRDASAKLNLASVQDLHLRKFPLPTPMSAPDWSFLLRVLLLWY